MSCNDCKQVQDGGAVAPYRFGIANIDMSGCDKHLNEVFAVLNRHQKTESEGAGGVDSKYGPMGIRGVPSNEPVFVLRAQDAHAVYMLQEYRRLVGSHNKHMEERMDLVIARFKAWHTKKLPD